MSLPFGARTFREARDISRAQAMRGQAVLALLGRTYTRDKDGKFSHTGGGVRDSLANATTTDELNATAAAEAKRITGHDIEFDMTGSDLGIAREHTEGVLRGLERYPLTPLERVRQGGNAYAEGQEAWAATSPDGRTITFTNDAQRYGAASYRAEIKQAGQLGELSVGTPMGIALHEFGHAAANHYRLNGWANNRAHEYAEIEMNTNDVGAAAGKAISRRAAEDDHELSAEAFADVMANGDRASPMSIRIVDTFDQEIRAADMPDDE